MSTNADLRGFLGDVLREMANNGMTPDAIHDEVRRAIPAPSRLERVFGARRAPLPGSVDAGCPQCGAAIQFSMGGTRGSAHCERSRSSCVHGVPEPGGVGSGACEWHGTLIRDADSDAIMIEPTAGHPPATVL